MKTNRLDDVIQILDNMNDAAFYHYEVKKKNISTGRYSRVADIPCVTDSGDGEDDRLKGIVMQSSWGGSGYYKFTVLDADDQHPDPDNPITFTLCFAEEKRPEEKPPARATAEVRDEKHKEPKMNFKEKLLDLMEQGQVLSAMQTFKGEENEEEPLTPQDIEQIVHRAMASREPQVNSQQDMTMQMFLMQQQQQQKQQEQFQTLLAAMMTKKDDTQPMMAEMTKAIMLQSQQNQQFMAGIIKSIQEQNAQRPDITQTLAPLLESPTVATIIKNLTEKKETPYEKILPGIIENTTSSFNGFTERIMTQLVEHQLNPPTDPKDKAQQQLALIRNIKDMSVGTIKELFATYMQYAHYAKQRQQSAPPQPQQHQARQPQTQAMQPQQQPPQQPAPPQQPGPQERQAEMQRQFATALEIFVQNAAKPENEIAEEIYNQAPLVYEVIVKAGKQDLLSDLGQFMSEGQRAILEKLIDYIKETPK